MADEGWRGSDNRFHLKWTLARKIGGLAAVLLVLLIAVALCNYYALARIGTEALHLRAGV